MYLFITTFDKEVAVLATGTCKSKRRAEMSNNQSIRKNKNYKEFWLQLVSWWCHNVARDWRTCFCLIDDMAVTRVYALWHIAMCARHVSQLLIKGYTMVYKFIWNIILVHFRNSSFGFTGMNWCPPWWTDVLSGTIYQNLSLHGSSLNQNMDHARKISKQELT